VCCAKCAKIKSVRKFSPLQYYSAQEANRKKNVILFYLLSKFNWMDSLDVWFSQSEVKYDIILYSVHCEWTKPQTFAFSWIRIGLGKQVNSQDMSYFEFRSHTLFTRNELKYVIFWIQSQWTKSPTFVFSLTSWTRWIKWKYVIFPFSPSEPILRPPKFASNLGTKSMSQYMVILHIWESKICHI